MKFKLFLVLLLINYQVSLAQNNRLETTNKIGWYSYTGTFKISEKVVYCRITRYTNSKFLNTHRNLLRKSVRQNIQSLQILLQSLFRKV